MLSRVALFLILFFAQRASAVFIDLNTFYYSDTLVMGTSSTMNRTFYDATIGFTVDKKGNYQIGWDYVVEGTTDTTTTTTTYAGSYMGPKFKVFFDKNLNWGLGLAYNLSATAIYTPAGGTAEKWRGTNLRVDFGYNLNIDDSYAVGFKINYSSSTFAEKLVNETTYTTVAYTRTFIFPSISFSARY